MTFRKLLTILVIFVCVDLGISAFYVFYVNKKTDLNTPTESSTSNSASSNASSSFLTYATPLTVDHIQMYVAVARTPEEHAKGLSGRERLGNTQGMLFMFTEPTIPHFWMKDMKFDLDLIWIKDNVVIGVTRDVAIPTSADKRLPTYDPPGEVDMVLEVNAGWSQAHEIKIGDMIRMGTIDCTPILC